METSAFDKNDGFMVDLRVRCYERIFYSFADYHAVFATEQSMAAIAYAEQSRCGLEGPRCAWPRP